MSKSAGSGPITVALIDDYDVVLIGLAHMFDRYRDRVVVAEIDAEEPLATSVDVALYDTFAQPEADHDDIGVLIASPRARHTAVYTWNFHPELVQSALAQGASGYLSKTLPAHALVAAIESIHGGEVVISPDPGKARIDVGLEWPGKPEGLSNRESEILALITQGKPNSEIARLTYLSPNTIKTYIRSAYRKIGVKDRAEATAWTRTHQPSSGAAT